MNRQEAIRKNGVLVYGSMGPEGPGEGWYQLLGKARELTAGLSDQAQVIAAVISDDIKRYANQLFQYGADIVCGVEHPELERYRPDLYIEALESIIQAAEPEIALILATSEGAEIGSAVAARLKTGLAAHCVHLGFDQKGYVQVVPAFAGKIYGDIYCPDSRPQMATVKQGMFPTPEPDESASGPVVKLEYEPEGFLSQVKLVSSESQESQSELSVSSAEVVVGGGLGIGSKENWQHIQRLAELLGGATGCTRPALDQGWAHDEHSMIGTSGVVIGPKLYMSVGISGAAHHTCGVKESALRIAINKDPDAPIFGASDIKIVADWQDIIPPLNQRLEQIVKEQ